MTAARMLAALALIALLGFYGIMVAFVPRIDLTAFIMIGILLVVYDLWTQLGHGR